MRYKYAIVFYVLLIIYAGYSIGKAYGFTYFPDEFGYWAYAARVAGYDWSDIASLGSYYSYGYSLVLFPIFVLFNNSVTAYRVAVGLNFLLIGLSFIGLSNLGRRFCALNDDESYIMAAVAMFYPPILFYGKSTMVEVLLAAVFILICVLMYAYIDNGKPLVLAGLVLCLVYIHFVHMRAVGIFIAGIITLIVYFAIEKKKTKQLLATICGAAVILLLGFAIKEAVTHSVYKGDTSVSDINDYAGQLYKIKYIFTKEGIKDFIEGLSGKILYMGLSTFGLAWFGIVYSIKKIVNIKKSEHNVVHIFILISTIAELVISTIYNILPARVDSVVYGRYHEFVFPILIMLGLCELIDMKSKVKTILTVVIVVIIEAVLTYLATDCIVRYGLWNYHGYVMAGMSYLYDGEYFEPITFMFSAYLFGILLTFIIVVMGAIKKEKIRQIMLIVFMVIELLLATNVSSKFTDAAALGTYRDLTIIDKIESLLNDEIPDRRILYITEDDNSFISVIQFVLRDEEITLLSPRGSIDEYTREEMNDNDILVLYYRSAFAQEAEKLYTCSMLNGHFYIFYNN
jgi:hypothetical protein